jgi:hypothetical protein
MDTKGVAWCFPTLGILVILILTVSHLFAESIDTHPAEKIFEIPQGDILYYTLTVEEGERLLSVSCFDRIIPVFETSLPRQFGVFIGVDLAQNPLEYHCEIEKEDKTGKREKTTLMMHVKGGGFGTQEVTVPQAMVDLDPVTLKRVQREQREVDQVWKGYTPRKLWEGGFIIPVEGEIKGSFGLRRVFNGQPRNPHTGEDFTAPLGAKVVASNRGIVRLVANHFFSGRSIFIDHGMGLYTMYFHLSKVFVKQGARIEKGQVIGLVGATGRASGPHLHWGLRMNDARVNPMAITRLHLDKLPE